MEISFVELKLFQSDASNLKKCCRMQNNSKLIFKKISCFLTNNFVEQEEEHKRFISDNIIFIAMELYN